MNEQLQAALAEMLGKANAGIDAGASFLQAQLPDVIQQLLVWKMAVSAIGFCLAAMMILAGITLITMAIRIMRPPGYHEQKEKRDIAHRKYQIFDGPTDELKALREAYLEADAELEILKPDEGRAFWTGMPGLGLIFLSLLPMSFKWLQIWLAPKIYLIEYAASLAK